MATDKKTQTGSAVAEPDAAKKSGTDGGGVEVLQARLNALHEEIEALKRGGARGAKVPVGEIYVGAPTGVPQPVQEVIRRYEALRRALLAPEPPWQIGASIRSRPQPPSSDTATR